MHRLLTTILAVFAVIACGKPQVALICDDAAQAEAITELVKGMGYYCKAIEGPEAISSGAGLEGCDLLWWHRTDTSAISKAETEAGAAVSSWLSKGGKAILSMDAVRLAHAWGLESGEVDCRYEDAIDDGFGRKVGFHAWRSHPLFDGLQGGAYVWHGHKDNRNRILGWFGDNMPKAEGSRIAAILWQLIFYHPEDKVIWEQPVGKGKLLSIGAFLYYGKPNYNKAILHKFTRNAVNYMLGCKMESPARYWSYDKTDVILESPALLAVKAPKAVKWETGTDADALHFEATRGAEVTLPGRRTLAVSEEQGGIKEIWTHPVMSLKAYSAKAGDTRLDSPAEPVELRFNSLIRNYMAEGVSVREVLVPHIKEPVTVAHYEWEGQLDRITIDFASNMRYMWPYDENALGSLKAGWSEKAGCYCISACDGEFVSLLGANAPGKVLSEGRTREDLLQASVSIEFDVRGCQALDVVMAAGSEGLSGAEASYAKAIKDPYKIFTDSRDYWKSYLANTASIVTPDQAFNEGYRWATVSAGQFLAETPGLGTALMAGYSSSLRGWGGGHRVSGRPGYAWYFGRDSELSALAFLAMGDFEAVRLTLDLLTNFQGINGPIFHELTTSGSDHFDASDATPLMVVLMAEYLRATGDVDYVLKHMENVHRAMDFCFSTDTNADGLIEIEHVGHGWLEGGDYFVGHTEFYLCGIWERALLDATWLSAVEGNAQKVAEYIEAAGTVAPLLENFWNEKGYYNYGLNADGTYSTAMLALPSVPVWLGVTDHDRSYEMVCKYAAPDFSQPWGVRQTNDPRPEEGVGAYDESNIWPLFTGSVSLAEYYVGRYKEGFNHLMASLLCYDSPTHGRVPEVLRGNAYRSGGITRHQCWSETAVTGPALQGMLGWKADAVNGNAALAPRLPDEWDTLKAANLKVGKTRIGMDMGKYDGEVHYTISSTGSVTLDFCPAFPKGTRFESVTLDGKPLDYSYTDTEEYTLLQASFEALRGSNPIIIKLVQ